MQSHVKSRITQFMLMWFKTSTNILHAIKSVSKINNSSKAIYFIAIIIIRLRYSPYNRMHNLS